MRVPLLAWLAAVLAAAAGPEPPAPLADWALAEPGRRLNGLAVSPDGRCVAVRVTGDGGADALAVVDVRAGTPLARVSVGPGPLGAPLWLAADRLAAVAPDGLWIFQRAGGAARAAVDTPSLPRRGQGEVQSNPAAWFGPDFGALPRLLASGVPSGTSPCPLLGKEGVVRFAQQDDGPEAPLHLAAELLPGPAAASGDGRRVAVVARGGVVVMDARTGVVAGRLAVRPEQVRGLLLDADGETAITAEQPVASVAPGGILTVWKVSTGARLASVTAASGGLLAAAGEAAFWSAGAGELACRRASDLALLARWGAPSGEWLAVSPDRGLSALAAGSEVSVVRLEDGDVSQVCHLPEPCGGLAFTAPDRLAVATGRHLWLLRTSAP
ncbi:MAG: hypothetical protein HYU66_23810 [Armatimonadetes bacterium]|nr:hypothetical protein [Armatimonadota bacterium]